MAVGLTCGSADARVSVLRPREVSGRRYRIGNARDARAGAAGAVPRGDATVEHGTGEVKMMTGTPSACLPPGRFTPPRRGVALCPREQWPTTTCNATGE